MNIVITGSSTGIGAATAQKFIAEGHVVYGIDVSDKLPVEHDKYIHYICDVKDWYMLPDINSVDILVNNAGTQNSGNDIANNLMGLMTTTKKYGLQPNIKSIVNLASVSASNGAEFPEYVASKGGVIAYTKWTAKQIAKYQATCNSLSFGGVSTELNDCVMYDKALWQAIMAQTPMKQWCSAEEAAEWIYFMSVVNKSCTGQDIIIDNLEMLNHKFIWV